VISLKNGTRIPTDYVILCTGFTHNLSTFKEGLRAQYGLPSKEDFSAKWDKLDALGEQKVNTLLPLLKNPPNTVRGTSEKRPCRLYRRLISPSMAMKGDRSIYFPGLIHSVYTPLVAELQALWGSAFMLGRLDLPDQGSMEEEVAVWNAWTRKRYLEQGRKHAYSIYDYLAVRYFSFILLRALSQSWMLCSTSIRLHEILGSRLIERAIPFPRCSRHTDRGTTVD